MARNPERRRSGWLGSSATRSAFSWTTQTTAGTPACQRIIGTKTVRSTDSSATIRLHHSGRSWLGEGPPPRGSEMYPGVGWEADLDRLGGWSWDVDDPS